MSQKGQFYYRLCSRVVVSVSRRSQDVPTSCLGLVSRKIVNVSVSAIYVLCLRPTQDHHHRYRADLYDFTLKTVVLRFLSPLWGSAATYKVDDHLRSPPQTILLLRKLG